MRAGASWLLRRLRREEGAVIPMVAMLLIVILGMAAFAIDISGLYFDQRHLQMQADSAVEAGAQQFVQHSSTCSSNVPSVEQVEANYAGVSASYPNSTVASSPVSANNEQGSVSIAPSVSCGGTSGSYVDATVTNSSPPTFFSGIFGAHPTVSAHARVSLEQVSEEGGSQVLPYAIPESQAVFNNKLIQIPVNSGSVKQALLCDGSGAANAGSATEMYDLQVSGCPLTQTNSSGTTCPASQLSPPSCLYEFTGVSESSGFDAGHVYRFENGQPWPGATGTCTEPNPIPTNNYAQYLSNGTLVSGDPRILTIFVVPDNTLSQNGGLIPIVGYATFYMAGWDHDPCIQKGTNPDPKNPGPQGDAGTLWGYFISYTTPESSSVASNGTPCNPVSTEAWTYNCTYALTQ